MVSNSSPLFLTIVWQIMFIYLLERSVIDQIGYIDFFLYWCTSYLLLPFNILATSLRRSFWGKSERRSDKKIKYWFLNKLCRDFNSFSIQKLVEVELIKIWSSFLTNRNVQCTEKQLKYKLPDLRNKLYQSLSILFEV